MFRVYQTMDSYRTVKVHTIKAEWRQYFRWFTVPKMISMKWPMALTQRDTLPTISRLDYSVSCFVSNSKIENDFDSTNYGRDIAHFRPYFMCFIISCSLPKSRMWIAFASNETEIQKAMIFIDVPRHSALSLCSLFISSMKQRKLGFSDTFRYLRFGSLFLL